MSVAERAILETPMAIIDLETTGFCAGPDKIIEVAVARVEPGQGPRKVLDTLVNPQRPVAATEVHGITDSDVAPAPTFAAIAGNVVDATSDAVLASYNIYFDAKFLRTELGAVGVADLPPHLCLMYLRPMLELGKKCTLTDACRAHGVGATSLHRAGSDVLATARLWQFYSTVLRQRGVRTFRDLAALKNYKFVQSFTEPLFSAATTSRLTRSQRLHPRGAAASKPEDDGTGEYWDAVVAALSDLELTPAELGSLERKRSTLGLGAERVRWVHAQVFSGLLAEVCIDRAIDDREADALWRVAAALRRLGWAPGDSPADRPGPRRPQGLSSACLGRRPPNTSVEQAGTPDQLGMWHRRPDRTMVVGGRGQAGTRRPRGSTPGRWPDEPAHLVHSMQEIRSLVAFQARDPSFETRVRASFGRQQAMQTLGVTLRRLAPGEVDLALPFSSDLTQQHGFLHAGMVTAAMDSACGYAALTLMEAGAAVLTVEFKVQLLAPARGHRFLALGRVIRAGRTLTVVSGEFRAFAQEQSAEHRDGELVALMTGTMMAVRGRPELAD
ncbi:MAG: exonuclease domain-containing protein [Gemmatimonadales bacterium]